ncbi:transposase family protein [Streptomyces antimycoticus]|uniref:transposase family protein n=1 Tax=Streptomyces antimycoticus TaxID=68175 RepID=UPI0036E36DFB
MPSALSAAPRLAGGPIAGVCPVPEGLLDRLTEVSDPRDPRGVRYRLLSLLAIGVCAMTAAGHNSLSAIPEWARRSSPETLRRLGLPSAR